MGIRISSFPLSPGQASRDDSYYLNGSTFCRETCPRVDATSSSVAALTSGVMAFTAIVLYAGETFQRIAFRSGGTAAVSPTNWWFALYDTQSTPALISQTASQGSAAWGSNTTQELSLPAPYTVTTSGVHYVAIMMAAGTTVNLCGKSGGAQLWQPNPYFSGQKQISGTSGSSLTTTAPATITGASANGAFLYATLRA